jgi:hypothetical protein
VNRSVILIAASLAAVAVVAVLVLRSPEEAAPEDTAATTADAPAAVEPAAPPSAGTPAPTTPGAPRARRPAPEAVAEAPTPEPAAPEAPPAPDVATLRIEADVPGAQVFLDRQFLGAAPVTAENVTPGSHQLNVSAEGFDGIARTIDVTPGARDITIRFREVRLDLRLSVVHKHRLGACQGELVATPQGLRYVTDNKDDAFTVPLADLETFQVEYLDKTLRVKLRRGRQFNFTDPDANADRLFVFHRDVDKARTQLARGFSAAP